MAGFDSTWIIPFHYSADQTFNRKFVTVSPAARSGMRFTRPAAIRCIGEKPRNYNELARQNEYYADVAASIQAVIEEVFLQWRSTPTGDGHEAVVHGRRSGLNSVCERKNLARDAIRRDLRPACWRWRWRHRGRALRVSHGAWETTTVHHNMPTGVRNIGPTRSRRS
jgi:hypothetical protein